MPSPGSAAYDVIVVGLGAMGAAATWQLALTGARTLGLDRFDPPHTRGSTHGDTRITRLAIGEGSQYVPLAQRSQQLWRTIEAETGQSLLHITGGLVVGRTTPSGSEAMGFQQSTAAIARRFDIAHEELGSPDLDRRFPQFAFTGAEVGYFEPTAGYVRPEAAVAAQLQLAGKHGAHLRTGERVLGFEATVDHVRVTTDQGRYRAARLVLTAGPWVSEFLPEYPDLFRVFRQVLYWFDLKDPDTYELYHRMPIFIWEVDGSPGLGLYGFPAIDGPRGGLKLATEQYVVSTSPDLPQAPVADAEIAAMHRGLVAARLPGLSARCVKAVTCLYTVTPDHGFVIDRHPEHDNVIVASPCSGHGFKHSAAIGEILAQLATRGHSDLDISRFSFDRPTLRGFDPGRADHRQRSAAH
jgi:sarcosine oxidase